MTVYLPQLRDLADNILSSLSTQVYCRVEWTEGAPSWELGPFYSFSRPVSVSRCDFRVARSRTFIEHPQGGKEGTSLI